MLYSCVDWYTRQCRVIQENKTWLHDNTADTAPTNSVHTSHDDPVHKSSNPNMWWHHQPFPWHKRGPCHPSRTVESMVHLQFPGPSTGGMLPTLPGWSWTLPVGSLMVCWMMTYSMIWTSPQWWRMMWLGLCNVMYDMLYINRICRI